jgi:hypothetical protein
LPGDFSNWPRLCENAFRAMVLLSLAGGFDEAFC